ncbi:MAG: hypothetical protein ACRC1X_07575 [Lactobacillus panisapium]
MKNDYISKWELFITSYLPLYLWLFFNNLDFESTLIFLKDIDFKHIGNAIHYGMNIKNIFLIVLFVFIIISIIEIIELLIGNGSEQEPLPKSMEVSPESDSFMNYVMTYFIPLTSFNIKDNKSIGMNILLFFLIGIMYVGSSATYLNPVLGLFGFKIFGVSGYPNAHHIISRLSFDEIETAKKRGDYVIRYSLGDGICIIKPV